MDQSGDYGRTTYSGRSRCLQSVQSRNRCLMMGIGFPGVLGSNFATPPLSALDCSAYGETELAASPTYPLRAAGRGVRQTNNAGFIRSHIFPASGPWSDCALRANFVAGLKKLFCKNRLQFFGLPALIRAKLFNDFLVRCFGKTGFMRCQGDDRAFQLEYASHRLVPILIADSGSSTVGSSPCYPATVVYASTDRITRFAIALEYLL